MSTPTVCIRTFPNNEIRATYYWRRTPSIDELAMVEKVTETLLDITSKLKPAQGTVTVGDEDDVTNSAQKPGHGGESNVSGFTLYGRRQLLRAGGALDESVDSPEDCLFLTGTLPGSTYEAKRAIANWSAYAVNLVQSWISKRVPQKLTLYVWEFQKRGALHLHYAVACPDKKAAEYICTNWRAQWQRVIDSIGLKAGVDMWRKNANFTHAHDKSVLQADAQRCRKSIANYLAKYVSKSQQQYKDNHWAKCKPSRYWGVSRPLNAILKSMSTKMEITLSNRREWEANYQDCLYVMQSYAKVSHTYGDKFNNAKVCVGYANPGELQWLLHKVSALTMKTEPTLKQSLSVVDSLYSRIQQAVAQDARLRELVLSFSDTRFLAWVESPDISGLSSSQVKELVILDYRWYISQAQKNFPSAWGRHSALSLAVEEWYKSGSGLYTTPTAKPSPTMPVVDVSDIPRNLQLTVFDQAC